MQVFAPNSLEAETWGGFQRVRKTVPTSSLQIELPGHLEKEDTTKVHSQPFPSVISSGSVPAIRDVATPIRTDPE